MNKNKHKFFCFLHIILTVFFLHFNSYPQKNDFEWSSPLHKCWAYFSNEMTRINGVSDNASSLYLPMTQGKILALDERGNKLWELELGGDFVSDLKLKNNKITASNEFVNEAKSNRILRQIDSTSGTILNSSSESDSIRFEKAKNSIYHFTYNINGRINLSEKAYKTVWSKDLDANLITKPIIRKGTVSFATSNKTFIFIDIISGRLITQIPLKSSPVNNIFYDKDFVFIGDKLGNLYKIDLVSKKIKWMIKSGGEIVSIVGLADELRENIIISSNDNFVYLIAKKNGKKIWKTKLEGRIIGSVKLTQDKMIFVTYGSSVASILDIKNGRRVNQINLDNKYTFVSKPLFLDNKIILTTQLGLFAYSRLCKKK